MRRLFGWIALIAVLFAGLIVAAFKFTPWPSVAIVAYIFSKGDQASEAALVKHVPAGIVTRRNLAYGEGPDEIFDVNRPENATGPLPVIVWVHGGGWVGGSKDGVANYLKVLSGRGYATVGVEYSRGFGAAFPKPVEQVNAALGYLGRNAAELGIDPDRVVLAGDSAGAQIAAEVAMVTTDASFASRIGIAPQLKPRQLAGILLLSGAYDPGALDLDGDYGRFVGAVLWAYSGTKDFVDDERFALASVTNNVGAAFPPAFISSGNGDPLAPQAVILVHRLESLGVRVDSLFFPADYEPPLPHEYQFNLDIAAGREALDRMLVFIAAAVAPAAAPLTATP